MDIQIMKVEELNSFENKKNRRIDGRLHNASPRKNLSFI